MTPAGPAQAEAGAARRDRRTLAGRIRSWTLKRTAPTDTLTLTHRNVYILPTGAGAVFAATLFVLLLASINYQLNLGYLLTFLLAGSGAVSMHITHRTLRGLQLHLRPPADAFAGQAAALDVLLTSRDDARHGIGLRLSPHDAAQTVWVDVAAQAQTAVALRLQLPQRGRHGVPTVQVETRFPLGLFKAWAVWRPASSLLVYPAPESPATPAPAPLATATHDGAALTALDAGETDGVRPLRRGDALNRIVWRKAARTWAAGGELVTRDTSSPARRQLWLDWQACHPLAPEDRLSRLTAWVLEADRLGARYGLQLPGEPTPIGHGDAHRQQCLQTLALWRAGHDTVGA